MTLDTYARLENVWYKIAADSGGNIAVRPFALQLRRQGFFPLPPLFSIYRSYLKEWLNPVMRASKDVAQSIGIKT
jgi:hypothetical protein